LWSWWDVSDNTSFWISNHILRALKYAKDMGYDVDIDINNIARKFTYKIESLNRYSINDIELLNSMALWNVDINYGKYIKLFDNLIVDSEKREMNFHKHDSSYIPLSFLEEKLLLQEVRQLTGLNYSRDTILKYKKDDILLGVYFSDSLRRCNWHSDDREVNLIAYRIVKRDTVLNKLIESMQLYFLRIHNKYSWNTYSSSSILMAIFKDLLDEGLSKDNIARVIVEGKENRIISKFPYKVELNKGEEVSIKKESGIPLYWMKYRYERVTKSKTGVEGFKIQTYFNIEKNYLEAGEPVELIAKVDVLKDASMEYIVIEIPIPGGCVYADKRQNLWDSQETHREYFKDQTVVFCENLNKGTYYYKIKLIPMYTGKYIINPAQVSLMYIPVVNANTDMKTIYINDR
jgi:uncharacterized protein YfaS (alpha-2-macroglobulin family)